MWEIIEKSDCFFLSIIYIISGMSYNDYDEEKNYIYHCVYHGENFVSVSN